MASPSTIKNNCYNFLNTNLRNIIDHKLDRNIAFDEFAESRGRSNRASSLALPSNSSLLDLFDKEQSFLHPVNLKPVTITATIKSTISNTVNSSLNILRRHSTSQCPSTEKDDEPSLAEDNSTGNPTYEYRSHRQHHNHRQQHHNQHHHHHHRRNPQPHHNRQHYNQQQQQNLAVASAAPAPAPAACPSPSASSSTSPTPSSSDNFVFFASGTGNSTHPNVLPLSNDNLLLHQRLSSMSSSSSSSATSSTMNSQQQPQRQQKQQQHKNTPSTSGGCNAAATATACAAKRGASQSTAMNAPPPVPKRRFQDKSVSTTTTATATTAGNPNRYHKPSSVIDDKDNHSAATTTTIDSTSSSVVTVLNRSPAAHPKPATQNSKYSSMSSILVHPNPNATDPVDTMLDNDDRLSIESSVFDDATTPYRPPQHTISNYDVRHANEFPYGFDGNSQNKKMMGSHRSSSDSNKTIDTGYMSSTPSTTTGADSDRAVASFRSRFSSEDTQSSLDSFMSGSEQRPPNVSIVGPSAAEINYRGVTDSPIQTNQHLFGANDVIEYLQKYSAHNYPNNLRNSKNIITTKLLQQQQQQQQQPPQQPLHKIANGHSNCSGGNGGGGTATISKITTVASNNNINPRRDGSSMPPKITPPPASQPKTPPLRAQVSFDSAKIIATSQILGAKLAQHFTNNRNSNNTASTYGASVAAANNGVGRGVGAATTQTTNVSASGAVLNNGPPRKGLNGILNKPPPLTQIHHTKMNRRQDSNISSDSFSITSSPGYNSKSMEAPLLQHASKINRSTMMKHQDSTDSFGMTVRHGQLNGCTGAGARKFPTVRQDSTISSDSFSQTSSPGYNSKSMEAPLLAHTSKLHTIKQGFKRGNVRGGIGPNATMTDKEEVAVGVGRGGGADDLSSETNPTSPIIKSASTPALQTVVRFQNGSSMSLQHKIVNRRKNSNPYVTRGRLKFRLCQILLNAVALLVMAGGLAVYFNAYPTVRYLNNTYIMPAPAPLPIDPIPTQTMVMGPPKNPAPGVCLELIVKFCKQHNVPYNYTVYPNYMGHFSQLEAQTELENYDALVDVRCYELVGLFLCSLFVPRCGSAGHSVPPCRSLCYETMRRCGFFFDVFGLELPDYLKCNLFPDPGPPGECVGHHEVLEVRKREKNPLCSGFLCDQRRCIPDDWRCDGHVDCLDQTDEFECDRCGNGTIYCGGTRCMSQKHVCDGIPDCPFGQDERNCIRLSERNGDTGKGILEVYKADIKQWAPACVNKWDGTTSPAAVCSMLGYNSVNASWIKVPSPNSSNFTMILPTEDTTSKWQRSQQQQLQRKTNLMKEFISCPNSGYYPVAELACSNFECGKIRRRKLGPRTRIVGGRESKPGDWPFIAAILGGPEEIFYCAGVLISDQWVLTASHCIGNHTMRNLNEWTIQLGITRRHSHTYYGQKVKVQRVIPHPQYNFISAHDNDIAMFQLATRVAFHEHLMPVCLPPALKEIKPGTQCTVIGWGKREDKNANPDAVHLSYEPAINEVMVPILHRDLCNEWLESLNVTEGMICAGYQEGGRDACQGDSGGPLLCRDPNDRDRWFVGGIVSWGIMCAHPKLPGVYANVPRYIPWIFQQIQKYSYNPTAAFP